MLFNTTQLSSFSEQNTILRANSHQTPIHTTTPRKHQATSLPQPTITIITQQPHAQITKHPH